MHVDVDIDTNSVMLAKAKVEEEAYKIFQSCYVAIKEKASKIYSMWKEDSILKSDLKKIAEKIAVYAVVLALEKKGCGEIYAEISKIRTKIKADGFYGHVLWETSGPKVEYINMSSQDLWQIVVKEDRLLQICLDFYGQELKPDY